MKRIVTLLTYVLGLTLPAASQTEVKDFQSYILPSPNAMTFQKYVDYPVDYSTGVADICVPIYTFKLKDITFPVSASFHASGRSTSVNFSPLGMNWALQASGMISREVRGRPDAFGWRHAEKLPANLTPQSANYTDLVALDQTFNGATPLKDGEYDVYSISIKGITYKFGIEGAYGYAEFDQTIPAVSSWLVSSITTPSADTIRFKYRTKITGLSGTFPGNRLYRNDATVKDGGGPNSGGGEDNFSLSFLNLIEFNNGKLSFVYDSTNANNLLLNNCLIKDLQNNTLRTIHFNFMDIPGTNLFLANNNSRTAARRNKLHGMRANIAIS